MMVRTDRAFVRGFTLVEVLAVVVIIGLAGAVVVPSLLRRGTLEVQAASRMLVSDILLAQNQAIATQESRQLIFEPAQNRYRITDPNGNTVSATWISGGAENYIVDFDTDPRFAGVTLVAPVFGATNPPTLQFDTLGGPVNGGTVDLISGNFRYRVTVAPFTGRVTLALAP